jgi:hypothetical protein
MPPKIYNLAMDLLIHILGLLDGISITTCEGVRLCLRVILYSDVHVQKGDWITEAPITTSLPYKKATLDIPMTEGRRYFSVKTSYFGW